jgi:hypothetical protein
LDSRRVARYLKTNPHKLLPNHDISIWIDYSNPPKFNDVSKMLREINFYKSDIMCYKHDERNCIFAEANVVKKLKLDYPDVIDKQMKKYRNEGYPENNGLFVTSFLIRKNNPTVNLFNEIWWDEIKNNSARDQLSQVYSAWKCNLIIDNIKIDSSVYSNRFLHSKIPHPKRWTI